MKSIFFIALSKLIKPLGIPGFIAIFSGGLAIVWRVFLLPETLAHIDQLHAALRKPDPKPVAVQKSVQQSPLMDWRRFPTMDQLARVHLDLHRMASTSGFIVPEVNFKTQTLPFTPLDKMNIDLAFTTTYLQFKQWLAMLMVAQPALNVEEIRLHRANTQQTMLDIQLRLRWYALRSESENPKPLRSVKPVSEPKDSDTSIRAIKERLQNDEHAIQQVEKAL